MKNNQKGFANTILIGVIIAIGLYIAFAKYKTWYPFSSKVDDSLIFNCKQDSEATPEISSISSYSTSVGDIIKIHGCNLRGFEGDKNLWIENKDGIKGILYGKRDDDNENIEVTLTSPICQKDNSYSGLPCDKSLTLTPGMYKIFVIPWGKESNKVSITIK